MAVTAEELSAGLARVCARAGLGALSLEPQRLTGGAVMESWRFAAGGSDYVLRRAPSLAFMEGRPQSETGPRNYLRPGIPSIQAGPGGPLSSHVPENRVSLHPEELTQADVAADCMHAQWQVRAPEHGCI